MTDGASDFALWREGRGEAPFIICAFFTAAYRPKAERLAASLDRLKLPFAIFEAPAVHRSISRHGGPDLRYCKPRFIASCLAWSGRPVLYVDGDVVFRDWPVAVERAVHDGIDFAVFNWLAAPLNDAWMPVRGQPSSMLPRFWGFAFGIKERSFDQLLTSGAVQFWRATPATHVLLQDWEAALVRFERAPDDHALDFAFNRGNARGMGLRAFWLPSDHVRYAHWPYVKPVIDHPDFPSPPDDHFADLHNRFDPSRLKVEPRPAVFPRDLFLDAHQGLLLRRAPQGGFEPVASLPSPLFLDDVAT